LPGVWRARGGRTAGAARTGAARGGRGVVALSAVEVGAVASVRGAASPSAAPLLDSTAAGDSTASPVGRRVSVTESRANGAATSAAVRAGGIAAVGCGIVSRSVAGGARGAAGAGAGRGRVTGAIGGDGGGTATASAASATARANAARQTTSSTAPVEVGARP